MRKVKKSARSSLLNSPAVRLVLITMLVLLIAGGLFVATRDGSKDSGTTVVRYGGNGPKNGSYEVLGTNKDGQTFRVAVVIKPLNDEELIALNDQLYKDYKDKAPSVFIDYFDDKSAATDYFANVSKPGTSDEQKKELVKHYKAVMVATRMVQKQLFVIGTETRLLKSY